MKRIMLAAATVATLTACSSGSSLVKGSYSPTPTPPSGSSTTVQLASEGLTFVTAGSTPIQNHQSFQTAVAHDVASALSQALGPEPDLVQQQCGQARVDTETYGGLTVAYQERTFVGWTDLGGTGTRFMTADGIGVGSTVADLVKLLPSAMIVTDSTGVSFTTKSDGLTGRLSGSSSSDTVTAMGAGVTCFDTGVASPTPSPSSS